MAGSCVAAAMRLVPERRRFRAALLIARLAQPLIRSTESFRAQRTMRTTSEYEIALHLVLHTFTARGITFEPEIDVEGYDEFLAAYREGRGMLLVSSHAAIGLILLRRFHNDGIAPFIVSAGGPMGIPGTRVVAETVGLTPMFLVQARSRLRDGRLVCAMVDAVATDSAKRTIGFETVNGRLIFAPALLQVAARCRAKIAFCQAHVENGRLRASMKVASSETAEAAAQEFISFVRTNLDRRFAPAPGA